MIVIVDFLAPAGEPSELRILLRQMALLWKFVLREHSSDEIISPLEERSLLIVDLGHAHPEYQEMVAHHVKSFPGRTLLFATQKVTLQPALKELSGVSAVVWHDYSIDLSVRILNDDPLLNGLRDALRLFRFNGSAVGAIEIDDAAVLLRSDRGMNLLTRRTTCYTIAFPVWQFGIVSFPSYFRMMENALFFNNGIPHLAPGPYVAFRIDDLPVTGQSSAKQGYSEARACAEIREIQSCQRLYGARMEYMLSSHSITTKGMLVKAQEMAPKAFRLLRKLYRRREINVGAHGVAHLDVPEYRRTCRIVPHEFISLSKAETRVTLESLREWISEFFEKDRQGFVAPAWGYKEGVTKPEAFSLFSYIADSNQHLQQSDGRELFGTLKNGSVSLFETWRSGMAGINMTDNGPFRAYLSAGLPIHLMLHGAFVRDPLSPRIKNLVQLFAVFAIVVTNLWLGYFCGKMTFIILFLLQVFVLFRLYSYRRYLGWLLRLALSRLPFGESARHLARVAKKEGAEWMFVEELAEHMVGYDSIFLKSVTSEKHRMQIVLVCTSNLKRPVSVHFPFVVAKIAVRPEVPGLEVRENVVRFSPLVDRVYEISASM